MCHGKLREIPNSTKISAQFGKGLTELNQHLTKEVVFKTALGPPLCGLVCAPSALFEGVKYYMKKKECMRYDILVW